VVLFSVRTFFFFLFFSVVTKRQQEVNEKYHKKAGELDLEQGITLGSTGPFRKELNEYGQKRPSDRCGGGGLC
jgi:hypothetical protein